MDPKFRSRLFVGGGGAIFISGILVWGYWSLLALSGFIVAVAMKEFLGMMEKMGAKPLKPLAYSFAVLYMLVGALRAQSPEWGARLMDSFGLITCLYIVAVLMVQMRMYLKHDIQTSIRDLGATVFAGIFIGGFMSFIFQIKGLLPVLFPGAKNLDYLMLLPFCGAWGSDTGAYFVGKFFGTKKLAPSISPKKTWEGAVGGILSGATCCTTVGIFVQGGLPLYHYPMLGLLLGTISLFGDLAMSTVKRESGVKDTGSMLAAHGGVLDRCDSLLLAMPTTYFYLLLFSNWRQGLL